MLGALPPLLLRGDPQGTGVGAVLRAGIASQGSCDSPCKPRDSASPGCPGDPRDGKTILGPVWSHEFASNGSTRANVC